MNLITALAYAILSGLILLLLILLFFRKNEEYIEINDAILGHEELEKHAVEIARNHIVGKSRGNFRWLVPQMNENFKFILDVYKVLNKDVDASFPTAPAAEWLLDNFYFIEEQIRDIESNLPKSYYSELPVVKSGYLRGYPRVYIIALELVAHTDGRIDEKALVEFIRAYQTQRLLSIGELWAVAMMIRIALLENIRHICMKIMESQRQWHNAEDVANLIIDNMDKSEEALSELVSAYLENEGSANPSFIEHLLQKLRKHGGNAAEVIHYLDRKLAEQNTSTETVTGLEHQLQAAGQVSIGNTVTSLKLVSTADWTDIFEALSHVESILRQDPADIYQCMDFESRDLYRHNVEKLAKAYRTSELNIARMAIECSLEQPSSKCSDDPARHIGYYLVGKGRRKLEEKICHNPGICHKVSVLFSELVHIIYPGAIILLTVALSICIALYAGSLFRPFSYTASLLTGLVVLIPASELATTIINYIASNIYRPYRFPKLELKTGIPSEFSTMVIIPTLLPNEKRVYELLQHLEIFYLSNREENLFFTLLGDHKDASGQEIPEDEKIISAALNGIKDLNSRYSPAGRNIFYYFHRKRQFNKGQGKWMGWERKRGAVMMLCGLLRGNGREGYCAASSAISDMPYIKYVITLDADTNLPMGSARKLVGTAGHPLNRPVINGKKRIVTEGHGLLQPRISVGVLSANCTLFSRIFAGQGGIDPYTTAVSDVYQDLFGEGIFTGKGIFDVDAFCEVLSDAIPENTVLSHDLLEGCYTRAGLVTDIELVDGYPARYNSYAMRLHRWVRGDWQLLPWLFPVIRDTAGRKIKNPLSFISKWKIVDNMRRSLVNPALMLMMVLGFGILPGSSYLWVLLAIIITASPALTSILNAVFTQNYNIFREKRNSTIICGIRATIYQTSLIFTFIPFQAYLMLDAVVRTLTRLFITRKNLLEWVTAADIEASIKNDLGSFLKKMWVSPFLGIAVFALAALISPREAQFALILGVLWSAAPLIAYNISKLVPLKKDILSNEDISELRKLARKTWSFFEDLVTESDNYLPPDNFQEEPPKGIAHRTSPTNIGLLLISIMSARDLGYVGISEMLEMLDKTILTIEKMDKWKGHLYNWYDTRTLKILKPNYVSTVDSGNFIGYLMTLEQGLKEFCRRPVADINMARGINDTLKIYLENPDYCKNKIMPVDERDIMTDGTLDIIKWAAILDKMLDEDGLNSFCNNNDRRFWGNKLYLTISGFKKEIAELLPILKIYNMLGSLPAPGIFNKVVSLPVSGMYSHITGFPALNRLIEKCVLNPALGDLPGIYRDALSEIDACIAGNPGNPGNLDNQDNPGNPSNFDNSDNLRNTGPVALIDIREILLNALNRVEIVIKSLEDLSGRVGRLVQAIKFEPLFDRKRQLFSIGFNVEEGRLSKSYYDLFASEARQASYISIARGETDQRHWFRMGRAMTGADGYKGLVSWTGTMFEYLMPLLIMRSYKNTLLDETYHFVVKAQIRYGRHKHIPWGISESGYSAFDINLNYQYKAFGLPGLGLKRGLGNDLVTAPYATVLALAVDPGGVAANMRRLKQEGLEGVYGFYEAVDYTPSRLRKGMKNCIVKSFMAHHQGMIFIALNNYLNNNIMQDRFHSDPMIKSAELLLQERVPAKAAPAAEHRKEEAVVMRKADQEDGEVIRTYGIPDSEIPRVHMISNGSYSVMVTDGGGGLSRLGGIAINRWRSDPRAGNHGIFIFVQNINSNMSWPVTSQPENEAPDKYRVVFSPDKAEYIRKNFNIETHTEITVSPEDNAEIRRVSLTNYSEHPRVLEVTSYLEPVLEYIWADIAHPAFNKLFIKTEFISEFECLTASKRPRSKDQKAMTIIHTAALEGESAGNIQYETDRLKFTGRNRELSNPSAMDPDRPLSNTAGAVIDPVFSLRRRVRIEPGQTARISYVVAVAENRKNAMELAEKYNDPKSADRAFEMAWTRSQIESRYLGFKKADVELYLNMLPFLFFPFKLRRMWKECIVENRIGQPGLWPFGISGDVPVTTVVIRHSDEAGFAGWLIKAHEYWRMKGLESDLVILVEDEGSYSQALFSLVNDIVSSSSARDIRNRRGGVFILNTVLMTEEERILICAASNIFLQGDAGPIHEELGIKAAGKGEQERTGEMKLKVEPPASGVPAKSTVSGKPDNKAAQETPGGTYKREASRSNLMFFNDIGGFTGSGREYVVLLEDGRTTPAPWVNVIANESFGFIVSESGTGYTWAENSRENKLTPWVNDPVSDHAGEIIYLKDETVGDYWSITPSPIREEEPYTVRHGFGYTVFEHTSHGIVQQLDEFVPVSDMIRIYIVKLKNISGYRRELSATYYVRPVMGVSEHMSAQHIITQLHQDTGVLLVMNPFNVDYPGRVAFIDSSVCKRTVTGDRYEFIGLNGNTGRPEALERKELSGTMGAGLDPCAALQVGFVLEAGEEKEIIFCVGQGANIEEAAALSIKYRDILNVRKEYEKARMYWTEKLDILQISTEDKSFDVMLNGWLLYQVNACRLWARSAFYQSGGAFGFRDQLQDVMALVYASPELTRKQIILHASRQFEEGDVQHWWHEESGKGIRTRYSDDLLWLVYVTEDYIKCTGDYSILDEEVTFLSGEKLGECEDERYEKPAISNKKAPVYEHCILAIEKALKYGEHGIPLMGSGDWNDGMNAVGSKGRGESVWLGWFLYSILDNFIPLCNKKQDDKSASRYMAEAAAISKALELNSWDGSWYLRAWFDDGTPLGSVKNSECKIDSISQSWSVISGAGRESRSIEAMDAVEKYLVDRETGIIKLLAPPFDDSSINPGYIKGYLPGVRENGGQYTHAAVWVVQAFTGLGLGDKAWNIYQLLNPVNHSRTQMECLRYKVEPYVMAADIYAVHPYEGRGGWTWYTGAAGWMYRTGVENILGFRKRGDAIEFSPCIPKFWIGYKINYKFNSTLYKIHVSNLKGVSTGVESISLDGRVLAGNLLPVTDDGITHVVEVVLGS